MRQYGQQIEEWARLPVEDIPLNPVVGDHEPILVGSFEFVCGWDGATRRGSHSASGMVLMTPSRVVLRASGIQIPVIDDPAMVELTALREAILLCLGQGFASVRFEGDAKVVIDKIRRGDSRDSRM
ncbi:unnamed protein product [Linum trigynum]|uniref:RNase H type-1 domain-containing protein n=1 Tax=Linum trigynum TaxID=586398 RepID=A0AAV2FEX2_9ROSI